jgi:hypothetical protein
MQQNELLFELRITERKFLQYGEIPILTAAAVYPLQGDEDENTEDTIYLQHGFTRAEHERLLDEAVRRGDVTPINPLTYVFEPFNLGEIGAKRLVTFSQFRQFARSLMIDVIVIPDGERQPIKYGPTMIISDIAAHIAMQYGVNEEAITRALLQAGERKEIPILDPQSDLPYTPLNGIKAYWDLMAVSKVNKWFEAQEVAYRVKLPGQSGELDKPQETPVAKGAKVKKAALVKRYERQWPTVQTDIDNKSRNGLDIASAGFGFLYEEVALHWARERGRISEADATPANSIWNAPFSKVHKCK